MTLPDDLLPRELPAMASWPAAQHLFEPEHLLALRAAQAAGRPLLVRGEPGTGKSQLAHAAAVLTRRAFLPFVVDSRTEASDLMWRFDAVARLADAHLARASGDGGAGTGLGSAAYILPGPLWWACDWAGAKRQAAACRMPVPQPEPPPPEFGWQPAQGAVLLVDEIDKAEAEVPNGLLEVLGNGRFAVPLLGHTVERAPDHAAPLVVVTTNDERELPAPFLRRCLVLTLVLPQGDALIDYLVRRGQLHFAALHAAWPTLLADAAVMLLQDRASASRSGLYKPGLAEYLDLLRAIQGLGGDAMHLLAQVRQFAFRKQPTAG